MSSGTVGGNADGEFPRCGNCPEKATRFFQFESGMVKYELDESGAPTGEGRLDQNKECKHGQFLCDDCGWDYDD